MENLILCRVCLVTNVKMYNVQTPAILTAYLELTGISDISDYPNICYECVARLLKCEEFRIKCFTAHDILTSVVSKEDIQRERKQKCLVSPLKKTNTMFYACNDRKQAQIELTPKWPEIVIDKTITIDSPNNELENNTNTAISAQDYDSDAFSVDESNSITKIDLTPKWPEIVIDKTITIDYPNNELENNTNTAIGAQDYDSDAFSVDESNSLTKRVSKRKFDQTIKSKVCLPVVSNHTLCLDATGRKPQKKLYREKENKTVNKLNKLLEVDHDLKSFQKFFTVVHLTTEDAKKEVELRKESNNYQKSIFKCNLCYRGFGLKKTFNNHMKKHTLAYGDVKCELCHLRCTANIKYIQHKRVCHTYKFICKVCPYICFSKSQAMAHMSLHEGETYHCDECTQVFRFRNSLIGHKRLEHSTEAIYVCAFCGDAFTTSAGLSIHNRKNHSEDTNVKQGPQCVDCDVHFATETAWKRHLVLSSKHETIESKSDCDICGATFPDLNRLKKHLRLIACEDTSTSEKKNRFRSRNEVKSCVCEICGEIFKHPCNLKYHRIKHTGESPYKCDICGKAFGFHALLEIHNIDFHSNTVFKCDICNKVFKTKQTITTHMRIAHLNTRQHKCDVCGKAFHHACEVKYHKQHVHDNVPWPKRDRSKRNRTN